MIYFYPFTRLVMASAASAVTGVRVLLARGEMAYAPVAGFAVPFRNLSLTGWRYGVRLQHTDDPEFSTALYPLEPPPLREGGQYIEAGAAISRGAGAVDWTIRKGGWVNVVDPFQWARDHQAQYPGALGGRRGAALLGGAVLVGLLLVGLLAGGGEN